MAIAAGDTIRLSVWCQCQSQASVNVLYYLATAVAGTPLPEDVVADYWAARFMSPMASVLSEEAAYRGVVMVIEDVAHQPRGPYFSASPMDGAITGELLPKQTCGIITKRTGFPGARNRGRMYLPFPGEASNEADSRPSLAYQVAAQDIGLLLSVPSVQNDLIIGGEVTWVPQIKGFVPLGAVEVTDYAVRPRWGTQRRRGDYGRANVSPV